VDELYAEVLALWREGEEAGLSLLDRTLEFYTRFYLQDGVLTKVDRATMMCSLESRAVFLDNDVVAFAERLPARFKFHRGHRKILLRKAMEGVLPAEVLRRGKKGFGIPTASWLRQGVGAPAAKLPAGIRGDMAVRRFTEHRSGRADHRLFLWAWIAMSHKLTPATESAAA
jgi:asparagine synthase (glutamine-hydrolysing)